MNNKSVHCPFGILNLGGLVSTVSCDDGSSTVEAKNPFFCHQSYVFKPTLSKLYNRSFGSFVSDGKVVDYQTKYRRDVEWDFGDGTKKEGYSVQHSYDKAGYYTITCSFFDINRRKISNSFSIGVVVKEVIPTNLRFDTQNTKTSIKCSKIEKITRLEASISKNVNKELKIEAKRIFDLNDEEENKKFSDLPSEIFKHSKKHWCFLENTQKLFYNSDKVYSQYLSPSDLLTPKYNDIYGSFHYDVSKKEIVFDAYQVIPYANIDNNLKTIKIVNPNSTILDDQQLIQITVNQAYVYDDVPSSCSFVGKRGFVDVFYKNDFVSQKENVISYTFDRDEDQINFIPLGQSLTVQNNDLKKVKLGFSLDGFLRQYNGKIGQDFYYFDPYMLNGLIKGTDLDIYVFPFIMYEDGQVLIDDTDVSIETNKNDFIPQGNSYYIPKDVSFTLQDMYRRPYRELKKQYSGYPSVMLNETDKDARQEEVLPWLRRYRFAIFDYIQYKMWFVLNTIRDDDNGNNKDVYKLQSIQLKQKTIDTEVLSIPTDKQVRENIDELIQVYFSHPMFENTPNVKDAFRAVLKDGNFVNTILTRSNNFIDDYCSVDTCYLSSLISNLKMMGENVLQYQSASFDGINAMRDLIRILTINHSKLVGHIVNEQIDISIDGESKGKHVGIQVQMGDVLTIKDGLISAIKRGENEIAIEKLYNKSEKVNLIIRDNYTNRTKLVNFDLAKLNGDTISLRDYRASWGWNLLLPVRGETWLKILEEQDEKPLRSESEISKITSNVARLINSYYSFYLFNPNLQKERIGNFLDTSTIYNRIDDVDDWYSDWGIGHELLLKVIKNCSKIDNNRTSDIDDSDTGVGDMYFYNIDDNNPVKIKGKMNISYEDNENWNNELDVQVFLKGKVENSIVSLYIDGLVIDTNGDDNIKGVGIKDGKYKLQNLFYGSDNDGHYVQPDCSKFETDCGKFVTEIDAVVLYGQVRNGKLTLSFDENLSADENKRVYLQKYGENGVLIDTLQSQIDGKITLSSDLEINLADLGSVENYKVDYKKGEITNCKVYKIDDDETNDGFEEVSPTKINVSGFQGDLCYGTNNKTINVEFVYDKYLTVTKVLEIEFEIDKSGKISGVNSFDQSDVGVTIDGDYNTKLITLTISDIMQNTVPYVQLFGDRVITGVGPFDEIIFGRNALTVLKNWGKHTINTPSFIAKSQGVEYKFEPAEGSETFNVTLSIDIENDKLKIEFDDLKLKFENLNVNSKLELSFNQRLEPVFNVLLKEDWLSTNTSVPHVNSKSKVYTNDKIVFLSPIVTVNSVTPNDSDSFEIKISLEYTYYDEIEDKQIVFDEPQEVKYEKFNCTSDDKGNIAQSMTVEGITLTVFGNKYKSCYFVVNDNSNRAFYYVQLFKNATGEVVFNNKIIVWELSGVAEQQTEIGLIGYVKTDEKKSYYGEFVGDKESVIIIENGAVATVAIQGSENQYQKQISPFKVTIIKSDDAERAIITHDDILIIDEDNKFIYTLGIENNIYEFVVDDGVVKITYSLDAPDDYLTVYSLKDEPDYENVIYSISNNGETLNSIWSGDFILNNNKINLGEMKITLNGGNFFNKEVTIPDFSLTVDDAGVIIGQGSRDELSISFNGDVERGLVGTITVNGEVNYFAKFKPSDHTLDVKDVSAHKLSAFEKMTLVIDDETQYIVQLDTDKKAEIDGSKVSLVLTRIVGDKDSSRILDDNFNILGISIGNDNRVHLKPYNEDGDDAATFNFSDDIFANLTVTENENGVYQLTDWEIKLSELIKMGSVQIKVNVKSTVYGNDEVINLDNKVTTEIKEVQTNAN